MTQVKQADTHKGGRRVFGLVEMVFDVAYLLGATTLGLLFMQKAPGDARNLALAMAFILVGGDLFHLVPRILSIVKGNDERRAAAMGLGKQITSITMTVFYVLLWHWGLKVYGLAGYESASSILYALAAVRIALCLPRANAWQRAQTPLGWALARNLPFIALGAMTAALYFDHMGQIPSLAGMGPAISLSFAFYLPVAFWVEKNRKLGMLMLPKTCMYIWILLMVQSYL